MNLIIFRRCPRTLQVLCKNGRHHILIANCYGLRGWCWCRCLDGNHGAQNDVYHGADYTPPHQAAPQPQEDERSIAAMLMKTDDSCSSKTCQVGHVLFKSSPFLHTGGYLSGMSSYTKWFMFMFIFAEKLKLTEKCSKGWFVGQLFFSSGFLKGLWQIFIFQEVL